MVIVDDHVVVRSGLEQFLATTDDIEMVGTAANGVEALERVAELHPDVVLMDLSMPEMNGIDATREIATLYPSSRVLVLTSFSDQTRILDALEAAADGYLLKHADPDDIAEGIRAVFTGGSPLDPRRRDRCSSHGESGVQPSSSPTASARCSCSFVTVWPTNRSPAGSTSRNER